jgi:hypothetical protein
MLKVEAWIKNESKPRFKNLSTIAFKIRKRYANFICITKSNQKLQINPKWVHPIFQQNTCKIP